MSIPNEQTILDITEDAVSTGTRSCFACMNWQLRAGGELIVCVKRVQTQVVTAGVTWNYATTCRSRAGKCKDFTPDAEEAA